MQWVFIAAASIALATFIGTAAGYLLKNISHKSYNCVIGFSSGIMLCAALFGLIEPSISYGGQYGELIAISGIVCGSFFLSVVNKLMPRLNEMIGICDNNKTSKILLLVIAIAVHHFPEGIAAGVSFGTESLSEIVMVCGGIAIQNIPEAAIIIAPMLNSGVSKGKALLIALISGGVEILGTFLGYAAVTIANAILPFALAFAGGSMIYIIIDEMVPQTHTDAESNIATYSAMIGFCFMMLMDGIIRWVSN